MRSVGYRVWDPIRGKVFNVGVSHIDESVQPGWWRKENNGGGLVDDIEETIFPDLDVGVVGREIAKVQEHDPPMPALVEDNSDEEEGEDGGDGNGNDGGGDDDSWGPDDDAPALPVHDVPTAEGGERSYIEAYLDGAAEEEAKHSPQTVQKALQGDNQAEWRKAMESLKG